MGMTKARKFSELQVQRKNMSRGRVCRVDMNASGCRDNTELSIAATGLGSHARRVRRFFAARYDSQLARRAIAAASRCVTECPDTVASPAYNPIDDAVRCQQ